MGRNIKYLKDYLVLFLDKRQSQPFLPARCFKRKGECQMCAGNDFVTYDKTYY